MLCNADEIEHQSVCLLWQLMGKFSFLFILGKYCVKFKQVKNRKVKVGGVMKVPFVCLALNKSEG